MNREKKRRKYAYRSVPHEIQGDINEFVICLALNLMHLLYVPSSFSRYFFDKATQNKLQCIFPLIVFILNFQIVSRTAIIIFV